MVSIINFYQYREEVKQALLAIKTELENEWDPTIASWIAYALASSGVKNNLPLSDILKSFEIWTQDSTIWTVKRNLAPLAFFTWLKKKYDFPIDMRFIERIFQEVGTMDLDDKMSPLRRADQMFLLALGFSIAENEEGKNLISQIAESQMRGTLSRQVLYAASLRELGSEMPIAPAEPQDAGDIIALLWWQLRYLPNPDKSQIWQEFANVKDSILLHKLDEFDARRILSPWEIALLYEALVMETLQPDPRMLFDYYPLHPRIRSITETDFMQGNYFGAVFEACKVLEDFLRNSISSTNIGVTLSKETLGDPCDAKHFSPKVKINALDPTSTDYVSQLDEQKGYSSITIGAFQAFRNPKGHQPKDKSWVGVDPYEALDQLVIISHLMKRIEKALHSSP